MVLCHGALGILGARLITAPVLWPLKSISRNVRTRVATSGGWPTLTRLKVETWQLRGIAYPAENRHDRGKSPFLIGAISSDGWFSSQSCWFSRGYFFLNGPTRWVKVRHFQTRRCNTGSGVCVTPPQLLFMVTTP